MVARVPGWLLRCCYGVARVLGVLLGYPRWFAKVLLCGCYGTWVVARVLLGYPGWLLRCCYAVARVPGVVARGLLCGSMWLLWYPGGLLRCCYAVARVLGVVAKVLLCGCYGTWGGC